MYQIFRVFKEGNELNEYYYGFSYDRDRANQIAQELKANDPSIYTAVVYYVHKQRVIKHI